MIWNDMFWNELATILAGSEVEAGSSDILLWNQNIKNNKGINTSLLYLLTSEYNSL